MLTVETLKSYGANVEEGLSRCLNNEAFYLKLVGKVVSDARIDDLGVALGSRDYDKAFEIAHSLKGMYGNLALTPIYVPLHEMTEYLRIRKAMDYSELLREAKLQKQKLDDLAES